MATASKATPKWSSTLRTSFMLVSGSANQEHANTHTRVCVFLDMLPYFSNDAKSGSDALPEILSSTNWFVSKTKNTRKILFSQTGWPTNSKVWKPNSPKAVASVESAKGFYQMLDGACEQLKKITPLGGVGWYWHIWKDEMLDGWGLIDWNGNPKWQFAPRTSC